MKKIRIAINGFGRIGRAFFRSTFGDAEFDIAAVNDVASPEALAYLLVYDSVYGRWGRDVGADSGKIMVDEKTIPVFSKKDPAELPWKDLEIDCVIESTGIFTSAEKARAHLDGGAKRVVITAPANGDVATLLGGVNSDKFSSAPALTANGSCTTNSVAPVLSILLDRFGIRKASLSTVHSYTATQKIVDGPDEKDWRRGRAAAVNIIPSSTGAAEAVIQALPGLEGKFEAMSVRVPAIAGSLSILTAVLEKSSSVEEINETFRQAAREPRWSKILKVSRDPIVSTDIIGEPYGAIVDSTLTKIIGGDLATIFSWYDNEAGYTATLIEHVRKIFGVS
jgi:glyceraldehyde 3-phosphate dehydrogenase